jgi:signal-transduction protein with cAMP-binding, CBS, and nucleotidyltransferase domain
MKQSRLMSLVEAIANVLVGYGVAVMTQILIFPVFGLQTTLAQNLKMGAIFTIVSIARSFALRRVFEAIRVRARKPPLTRRRLPYRRDFSGTAARDQSSIR